MSLPKAYIAIAVIGLTAMCYVAYQEFPRYEDIDNETPTKKAAAARRNLRRADQINKTRRLNEAVSQLPQRDQEKLWQKLEHLVDEQHHRELNRRELRRKRDTEYRDHLLRLMEQLERRLAAVPDPDALSQSVLVAGSMFTSTTRSPERSSSAAKRGNVRTDVNEIKTEMTSEGAEFARKIPGTTVAASTVNYTAELDTKVSKGSELTGHLPRPTTSNVITEMPKVHSADQAYGMHAQKMRRKVTRKSHRTVRETRRQRRDIDYGEFDYNAARSWSHSSDDAEFDNIGGREIAGVFKRAADVDERGLPRTASYILLFEYRYRLIFVFILVQMFIWVFCCILYVLKKLNWYRFNVRSVTCLAVYDYICGRDYTYRVAKRYFKFMDIEPPPEEVWAEWSQVYREAFEDAITN